MTKIKRFLGGFSVVDFSAVRFLDSRLNATTQPKNHCSCISLIFTGKAMHFCGLISKLMVLLRKKCIVAKLNLIPCRGRV